MVKYFLFPPFLATTERQEERRGKKGDNLGNLTVQDRKKDELHRKEVYNSYKSIKISFRLIDCENLGY